MTGVSTLEPKMVVEEALKNSKRLVQQLRILLVYQQIVTGKGLEFERLREYVPGDEAKMIDWNSLARTGDLYTKIFKEERMLDVVFVVDLSKSMTIGTTEVVKNEYASIVATSLARTALDAGDKVGLIGFSEGRKATIEPSLSDEIPFQFARTLSDEDIYGGEADWGSVKESVMSSFGSDTFVFVISDFVNENDQMYDFLMQCNDKFRGVFSIMVRDPLDSHLPEGVGKAYISDPETGELDLVDVDDIRDEYNERAAEKEAKIQRKIESTGGHFFKIHTRDDFVEKFAKFLDQRSKSWK
jgi:uncharacterized protein (DUF58 family)